MLEIGKGAFCLVLCSKRDDEGKGGVKTYQLVQVPPTDAHVTLILIHTVTEVTNVGFTSRGFPGLVGSVALPEPIVHSLGLRGSGLLGLSRSARATTAKKPSDSMADGRTDCDTTKRNMCVSYGF